MPEMRVTLFPIIQTVALHKGHIQSQKAGKLARLVPNLIIALFISLFSLTILKKALGAKQHAHTCHVK